MNHPFSIKLLHCGNHNFADPRDQHEKSVFFMPMGYFSMASVLKNAGFDVEIIHLDLEEKKDITDVLGSVDAVGLDCHWANQSLAVVDTAALIKKTFPGTFVFLGGYTATFFAAEILDRHRAVDAVVRGDGEVPLLELYTALRKNKDGNAGNSLPDLAAVPNLGWRNRAGEVLFNPMTYTTGERELAGFDFAALELLRDRDYYRDLCKYWTVFPGIGDRPLFLVETGRGCVYGCATCGGEAMAQVRLNNRKGQVVRPVPAVLASIKKAMGFGFSCFLFSFRFSHSDEWYEQLFGEIRREKLPVNVVYESWDLPTERLVAALSASCEKGLITISPESADEELRAKNKDKRIFHTNGELEQRLEYIRSLGNLVVQVYFGFFLPFDTAATIYGTMDYICRIFATYRDFVEPVYMNFNTDPCSPLFLDPEKYRMTVTVKSFEDFTGKLRENYIRENYIHENHVGEEHGDGALRLLSWPSEMSEAGAVDLANKVYLFNRLFLFRDSMAAVLEASGRKGLENLVSGYLAKLDLSNASAEDFGAGRLKKIMLDLCGLVGAGAGTVDREYRELRVSPSLPGGLFSYYTHCSRDGVEASAQIMRDREAVSVDLDFDF